MEENYQRGDLSGIVYSMGDDMVRVRFLDRSSHAGKSMSCRMVVRADGSLAIDPSGLPVRTAEPERIGLPVPTVEAEEVTDAELVESHQPGLPAPTAASLPALPEVGSKLEVQVKNRATLIYVGTVVEADYDRVKIAFDQGSGVAVAWEWVVWSKPRIKCWDIALIPPPGQHVGED